MNPCYPDIATRIEQAGQVIEHCELCPRRCGVNRAAGQTGYCQLDAKLHCFREMLHPAEEPGLNPSHQIYLAGCNLRCEYCTVAEWNERPIETEEIGIDKLTAAIERRRREGARTLNFLGGEPAVNLHAVLSILARLDDRYRVIFNTNLYFEAVVNDLMHDIADVYLADLKCYDRKCCRDILGAEDYFEVASANLHREPRPSETIVRHLILPEHEECCTKPILEWIAQYMPNVPVSLRGDYIPPVDADYCPTGYVKREQMEKVYNFARKTGVTLIE